MKTCSRILFFLGLTVALPVHPPAARADGVTEAGPVRDMPDSLIKSWRAGEGDRVTKAGSVRDAIDALLTYHNEVLETAAEYYTKSGYNHLQSGNYFDAAQQFQFALSANPEYALAYYLLAHSYIGLDRIDEALQALETARRLNPGYGRVIDVEYMQLQPEVRAARRLEAEERAILKQKADKQEAERRAVQRKAQQRKAERIIQKILEVDATPAQPEENDILKLASKPATPSPGTYCFTSVYRDLQNNLPAKELKGYLVLEPNGLYRWTNNNAEGNDSIDPLLANGAHTGLDSGPVGRYRYDTATHEVTFLSGLLAQPGIIANYDNNGTDSRIFIRFTAQNRPGGAQAQATPSIEWQGILFDNKALQAKSVHEAITILRRARLEGTGEFSLFISNAAKNPAVTPGIHTVYGLDYLKAKKYLDATWELKAALSLNPNYAPAYFLLGLAYTHLQQFEEARQSLEQAGRLNVNYRPEIRVAAFLLSVAMQEAKTPSSEAGESFKAPPTGTYICRQVSFTASTGYQEVDKGYFFLNSNGTYRWLDQDTVHYYSYDAANKEVKFISGPFAQPGVTAAFKTDYTSPAITIKFNTADSQAQRAMPIQWLCVRRIE